MGEILRDSYKFLDISGYIVSGKTAYSDLIREFSGYHVPPAEFEFELIRIQGGVRDLESALVEDWSPIRADAAIRRFKRVIARLGTVGGIGNIRSWFSSAGWSYDRAYEGKFTELSKSFLQKMVLATWKTNWPYPRSDLSGMELFIRKIQNYLGIKTAWDFDISLASSTNFLNDVQDYLSKVLIIGVPENTNTVVTHNAIEPFNPTRGLRYLPRFKCIIIDRDPRDAFVAMYPHKHLALNVKDFISRFLEYRKQAERFTENHDLVLRLKFEDLIFDYEKTLEIIYQFLGETKSIHVLKKKYFDPEISIKNTGIWKSYHSLGEIDLIKSMLPNYCDVRID